MRRVIPVVLVALFLGTTARAEGENDGTKLLRWCGDSAVDYWTGYCFGYLTGVVHATQTVEGEVVRAIPSVRPSWCIPSGVENEQTRLIVVKWLKANPEKLHGDADILVQHALVDAFPCETPTPAAPAPGPGE